MPDPEFPKPVEDIVATLADIYRYQNQQDIVEMLETGAARIDQVEYDSWNGGTYTYALTLDVPVAIFAGLEKRLGAIEKDVLSKIAAMCRNHTHHFLNSVAIAPLTSRSTSIGPKAKPAEADVRHIWTSGLFRLFLSHVSAHKVNVSRLKAELELRGVTAFVAHEDIEPSKEWQNEIELGMSSMQALACLLTPDFHQSKWTDQEVGFALGKGVLVIPVRLGCDPYGFIGKVQGLSGSLEHPDRLAGLLVETLLTNRTTGRAMRKALVSAFGSVRSPRQAETLSRVIVSGIEFTDNEKAELERVCSENKIVFGSPGVSELVCKSLDLSFSRELTKDDDVPF